MDINWTYCDHFVIYSNIKLCCTHETNITYVNYTSIKKLHNNVKAKQHQQMICS